MMREPILAAALDKHEILIVIRDTNVHSEQFRGHHCINKALKDDTI